jgi:succinyl-CoA synthetase alpha subunit
LKEEKQKMSILINRETKVLIQGITGKEGMFHTKLMKDYGTNIVAGLTPGKYGEKVLDIPVYDTIKEVLENHKIDASGIFVPAKFTKEAAFEAIDAGIKMLVILTEGIPIHDVMKIKAFANEKGVRIIGPNTPGVVTVGQSKLGLLDTHHEAPGNVGVISRSGTLTTEITASMVKEGIGQSTIVGIGGDQVVGSTIKDILVLFEQDEETKGVVIVGEIGGTMEEEAAEYVREKMTKPVVAWIAGRNAPEGKRLGHAGAIVEGEMGTAESKIKALSRANISIAHVPWEVGKLMREALN